MYSELHFCLHCPERGDVKCIKNVKEKGAEYTSLGASGPQGCNTEVTTYVTTRYHNSGGLILSKMLSCLHADCTEKYSNSNFTKPWLLPSKSFLSLPTESAFLRNGRGQGWWETNAREKQITVPHETRFHAFSFIFLPKKITAY